MDDLQVTPIQADSTKVNSLVVQGEGKPKRTCADWLRDVRMSAAVNKTTVGVETERVTPDLMLATSKKLLKVARREEEPDPKDSLEFQRFYGPAEYFAEHIMRDGGKLGRNLLWKATNKGNLDFMQPGALDQHVSDVFYNSMLAQMVDGSSPLELAHATYKTTRIGEGGVGDMESAPDEMRLVQPSFFGYIDPVLSPESQRVGLDSYITKNCIKGSDGKLYTKFVNAHTGKEELVDSVTAAKSVVAAPEMRNAKTKSVFALGGPTGVRIVPRSKIDYYLPHADNAYSMASNMVPMFNGVKEMRLVMGCLHPATNLLVIGKRNEIRIVRASELNGTGESIYGCGGNGSPAVFKLRNTVAKPPFEQRWFRKITLISGRTLTVSKDHRCPLYKGGAMTLEEAGNIRKGDRMLRTAFTDIPNRRTFVNGRLVNREMAAFLGLLCRDSHLKAGQISFTVYPRHMKAIEKALNSLGLKPGVVKNDRMLLDGGAFTDFYQDEIGSYRAARKVPSCILSANADICAAFLDAYTSDKNLIGEDACEDIWILDIPNTAIRDGLALLLSRLRMDCAFRDCLKNGVISYALRLFNMHCDLGSLIADEVKSVDVVRNEPYMVDLDIDDNLYATANGIVTHNSKYAQQAVSLQNREAPLVRCVDQDTGKDMPTLAGKYLGAQFASKPGRVLAVRQDRIDVQYDDGTKGAVPLYVNFPMNAKGYITSTPQIKAGDHFGKGDCVASSNYTDDKGVSAIGTTMRTGWLSWKGGTYEDGVTLSESAAKKLTSTTMYKSDVDLDKTIKLGKANYTAWKPSEYNADQLGALNDNGVVKPGTVLHKGDPMILAVRTAEPSPGTLGKRILIDMSETWDHDNPGTVTDVVQTRKGVKVFATVTAPAEVGDKVAGAYGNKGVIAQILPDDQMPQDKHGKPLEMLFSPLGLVSRTNPSQLHEAVLGKIAKKTGEVQRIPQFYDGDLYQYVMDKAKQAHVDPDDDFTDPETGRTVKGVVNGYSYIYKLKHLAESKLSARGTDEYDQDQVPAGKGMTGSKRYGGLEQTALVGHNAFDAILDAKLLRGQSNAEFWRSIRTGGIPTIPGEPLVHRKFFAHLTGAGINVRKTPKGVSCFTLSKGDVNELAGPRELKSRDTYEAKTFRPIDGGLFGQDIFGMNGDKWAYIKLDEPLPNPVMEEPLARLLRIPVKDFEAVASGTKEVDGMKSSADIEQRLKGIDLAAEAAAAKQELKDSSHSKRDNALKRYVAIENMRRNGVKPEDYMLDKIPVLPPIYRPISSHSGLTMVADSNYLYAQLLDMRDDLRDSRSLPAAYQQKARANLYRGWKELTGLYDPEDVKLKNKNVGGLLKWALGDSPKWSAWQRKVVGATVDTVGRGVVTPDPRIKLNELGIPKDMAFGMMAPFVERELVKRGYTPIDAMKAVKQRTKLAGEVLLEVMKTHPVQMNRAPTLHKYNVMAFQPVLAAGHAIHVNPSVVVPFNMDFDGDTANIHVPVSDNARKDLRQKMFPERNLLGVRDHKILYKPEKEYQQGLYIATRMKDVGKTPSRMFNTVDEARQAYRDGLIDIDDPITIRDAH